MLNPTQQVSLSVTIDSDSLEWLEAHKKDASTTVNNLIEQASILEPVLRIDWLKRNGTIFALSYWENEYCIYVERNKKLRQQENELKQILDDSGKDEDLELENLIEAGIGLETKKMD